MRVCFCVYTTACMRAQVYFPKCQRVYMSMTTLGWRLVAFFFLMKEYISFLRSPATSAAHLTCRNRPKECSLINLNYSFPDSAAPRSVVNPGFWFKSSECRLFRQRGPLKAFCQMLTNLTTDATYIHHKVLVCAPTYQCCKG